MAPSLLCRDFLRSPCLYFFFSLNADPKNLLTAHICSQPQPISTNRAHTLRSENFTHGSLLLPRVPVAPPPHRLYAPHPWTPHTLQCVQSRWLRERACVADAFHVRPPRSQFSASSIVSTLQGPGGASHGPWPPASPGSPGSASSLCLRSKCE